MRVSNEKRDELVKHHDIVSIVETKKPKAEYYPILVLDSSGSMEGAKYDNASKGVQELGEKLNVGVFIEFSNQIKELYFQYETYNVNSRNKENMKIEPNFMGFGTKLYTTINKIFNNRNIYQKKCLINIFTDGAATDKDMWNAKGQIKQLIEEGHVFTFVCTKEDRNTIINNFGVPESNVLSYENNAEGVKKAFDETLTALETFSKRIEAGEDVSLNFYSKKVV